MSNMMNLLVVAVLGLVVVYWWEARGAKAWALHYARQRCQALGLQLLDQSVVLTRLRLQRSATGSLQWHRFYGFEFSPDGVNRYKGELELEGRRCARLDMDAYIDN